MSMGRVVIACHSGPKIGLGHLRRCQFLKERLPAQINRKVEWVHVGATDQEQNITDQQVSSLDDFFTSLHEEPTAGLVLDFHPDHIDMNELGTFCKKVRRKGIWIVALDRLGGLLPWIDLLFVPCFFSKHLHPKVCFGWDHYLVPVWNQPDKDESVLVLSGGGDPLGFGDWLPDFLIRHIPEPFHIHWVQGPHAKPPTLPTKPPRWTTWKNPPQLQELLGKTKVVITAYGVSFFESLRSQALTILLEPQKLCERTELSLLEAENLCLIAQDQSQLEDRLKDAFSNIEPYRKFFARKVQALMGPHSGDQKLADWILAQPSQMPSSPDLI